MLAITSSNSLHGITRASRYCTVERQLMYTNSYIPCMKWYMYVNQNVSEVKKFQNLKIFI